MTRGTPRFSGRVTTLVAVVASGFALLVLAPEDLLGQSDELARIDELLEGGRYGEARVDLERWLDEEWEESARRDRQHGLWLRAVLTIDPGMAELDLRRLVVEYPGGSFSDEALLRLAHAADLREEDATAVEYLEILLRDYPESPHRVEARSLLASLPEEEVEQAEIPAEAESEPTSAGDEPTVSEAPPVEPSESEPAGEGAYAVQVGAFSTEARARSLALEMQEAGFEPRVARLDGSELARVRLGSFGTREEAAEHAEELRERGFEAVVAADREEEEVLQ